MIKKILIFNYTEWNQIVASFIEGLKLNKDLELFSTTETNYAGDISINTKHHYFFVAWEGFHTGSPDMNIHSTILEENNYVDECINLMGECDLIIIFDCGHDQSSAHYYVVDKRNKGLPVIDRYRRYNTLIYSLHEYAVDNYKDKIVMINPTDWSSADQMYGNYKGGHPNDCKIYFKREKDLDLEWEENVEPMPFSSEERYFTAGKKFNDIWNNKSVDVSCLFRIRGYMQGEDLRRGHIRRVVRSHCDIMGNIKYIADDVYDDVNVEPVEEIERQINGMDISPYKFKYDKTLGRPRWHHRTYYDTLLKTKINIDGVPGARAFYTGRMMESLANGCCYFYPKPNYRVDFPNGLIDGTDFVIYNTSEDLVDRLHYYLNHPNEMRGIAENGFNKLLKYHTSKVRAKEFIETCERYMK